MVRSFIALLLVLAAGLWCLDTRQPAAWPDGVTPWFAHVRALAPAAFAVDLLDIHAPITPDLAAPSAVLLVLIAACTLATLLRVGVPAVVAVAVALSLAAVRSVWSSLALGHDAFATLVAAAAILALTTDARTARRRVTLAVLAILLAPAAAWGLVPLLAAHWQSTRARVVAGAIVLIAACCVQGVILAYAWQSIACLDADMWLAAIGDVLRPGLVADASPWLALRGAATIVLGDVHVFGVAVAAWGLARAAGATALLRGPTLATLLLGGGAVAAGLLPSVAFAQVLVAWWAVWFGLGLARLLAGDGTRVHAPGVATAAIVAVAIPVLRHATVEPTPWAGSMRHVTRAVAPTWRDGLVASDDATTTRRLRLARARPIPASPATLDGCLAAGVSVRALGDTIPRIESLGYDTDQRPVSAPLSAVLQDLRADQLVALAVAPEAVPWFGTQAAPAAARVSVKRDSLVGAPALAVIARTDGDGDVRMGRDGVEFTRQPGDRLGARTLPVAVDAHAGRTMVATPPQTLASSRHAALAVIDGTGAVALRAVGAPAPGLPVSLQQHVAWRQVALGGRPACVDASLGWTHVPLHAHRLGVPVVGASSRRPLVLYLASAEPPAVSVSGFSPPQSAGTWIADTFDTQQADDVRRLREVQAEDGVSEPTGTGRWMTRVRVVPRVVQSAHRVVVTAGVSPDAWLVRLPAPGHHPETRLVCATAAPGDRLLLGHDDAVDDRTAREIVVWAAEGWHGAERVHGQTFQWTARTDAVAVFRLARQMPVTLTLDVTGAHLPTGAQPVTVRLNGQVLRTELEGAADIALPVEVLRAGENTLTLSVGTVVQPPVDNRTLGILVRQLRVIS